MTFDWWMGKGFTMPFWIQYFLLPFYAMTYPLELTQNVVFWKIIRPMDKWEKNLLGLVKIEEEIIVKGKGGIQKESQKWRIFHFWIIWGQNIVYTFFTGGKGKWGWGNAVHCTPPEFLENPQSQFIVANFAHPLSSMREEEGPLKLKLFAVKLISPFLYISEYYNKFIFKWEKMDFDRIFE